ncbi:CDGSH iron-sulfur domain-containing protein [Streptomyces sp. M10(2022)]
MTTADGEVCVSERFVVAVCVCRRSRTYPWCDTSHRRREPAPDATADHGGERSGHDTATTAPRANDADTATRIDADTAEGEDTTS